MLKVYAPVVAKKPAPDVIVILYSFPAIELGAVTESEPPPHPAMKDIRENVDINNQISNFLIC